MQQTYLKHAGIKGQKWGIRRYQNEDGSLTDAGKARYRTDGTKITAKNATNKELDYSNNRLMKENTFNINQGNEYKNPGRIRKNLISIGATTVISGLAGFGAKYIESAFTDGTFKIAKESLAKCTIWGVGTAAIGAAASTATVLGGQARTGLGSDNKKKK